MKILSIDIDYIAEQYLKNMKAVGGSFTKEKYWDTIVDVSRMSDEDIQENQLNIRYIFKTFLASITTNTKVVFGVHHDSILNHIPKTEKDLSIINIDEHHDSGYNEFQNLQSIKYGESNEANWVGTLSERVHRYVWVRNKHSIPPTPGTLSNFSFEYTEVQDTATLDVSKESWDLVYVCLSPNYTYDKHWVYFYLMVDLYEELSGATVSIDETRASKHF